MGVISTSPACFGADPRRDVHGGADEALVALDGLAGIDPYADPDQSFGVVARLGLGGSHDRQPQATAWRAEVNTT